MNEHKTWIVNYVPSTIRDELRYLTAFNKETSLVVVISFSGESLLRFWQLKKKKDRAIVGKVPHGTREL